MSTRGFVGFVLDGAEKIAYNHCDSYPGGLGLAMLNWARANAHALNCDVHQGVSGGPVDLVRELRVVTSDTEPTDEDIARLAPWMNTGVGGQKGRPDWYQLLRETQGDPAAILKAGVIEDAGDFPADSLFAEWGYVLDLDARTFETYEGFQKAPHDRGRFAGRKSTDPDPGYHPVALVASWPLSSLPSDDEFMKIEGDA
jgi:hypothetical protein